MPTTAGAYSAGQNKVKVHGGYCITVITPVCGTGNSGSIPGSRPEAKSPLGDFCVGAATELSFLEESVALMRIRSNTLN